MFSRSRSSGRRRYNFNRPKKETNGERRRGIRPWIFLGRNKDRHHDDGVMMSGDSPPPPLRVSGPPSPGFDISDEGRAGKNSPTSGGTGKVLRLNDTEAIEEAVPIIEKTLPAPEPRPKIERNGSSYDTPDGKKLVDNDAEGDSCVIKCLSFTQQCCDCTVL